MKHLLTLIIFGLGAAGAAVAAPAGKSTPKKVENKKAEKASKVVPVTSTKTTTKKAPPKLSPTAKADAEFVRLEGLYRMGALNPGGFWTSLDALGRNRALSPSKRLSLKQYQASLLIKAGYPLAAATYAYDAIRSSANPTDDQVKSAWKLMHTVSMNRPIQYLLEDMALNLKLRQELPPNFGNDWNYIVANGLNEKGDVKGAEYYYQQLKMGDRYFMPSRYQLAMISLDRNDANGAESNLNTILNKTVVDASPLKSSDKAEMWNYANMALGRIAYERQDFYKSVQHYRKVRRDSPLFYDALFEQSWALFMSGNPKHALGTIYGVKSPYFQEYYNPEADLLDAMVYYWLCRYDHSRNSLANFAEHYAKSVEGLRTFLDRKRLTNDAAYQLFEDLITGVSGEALGIPRNILSTAAEKDAMRLARDQYATIVDEKYRMEAQGVHGVKDGVNDIVLKLDRMGGVMRKKIGEQFLVELKSMKAHFDELYSQSQFLYLELLMSEKEQLMGSELHAATKVTNVNPADNIRGWTPKSQSWKGGKEEFWWDEIGYHIVAVEPRCNIQ